MARIGDVYEINTPKEKGYFQYWGKVNRIGSLIRVLQGVYDEKSVFDDDLVNKKEVFWIFFPVETARRQKIVKRIGKYNIPSFAKEAPLMRTTSYNIKNGLVSGICDKGDKEVAFSEMPEEAFFKISIVMSCNAASLIQKIAEQWTPAEYRF